MRRIIEEVLDEMDDSITKQIAALKQLHSIIDQQMGRGPHSTQAMKTFASKNRDFIHTLEELKGESVRFSTLTGELTGTFKEGIAWHLDRVNCQIEILHAMHIPREWLGVIVDHPTVH